MIELVTTRPTSTTVAAAISAAIMSGQLPYPPRVEPYEVQQIRGTYSDVTGGAAAHTLGIEHVARQVAAIYSSFAQRQERLGAEFEAAIFSDLEGLYEA